MAAAIAAYSSGFDRDSIESSRAARPPVTARDPPYHHRHRPPGYPTVGLGSASILRRAAVDVGSMYPKPRCREDEKERGKNQPLLLAGPTVSSCVDTFGCRPFRETLLSRGFHPHAATRDHHNCDGSTSRISLSAENFLLFEFLLFRVAGSRSSLSRLLSRLLSFFVRSRRLRLSFLRLQCHCTVCVARPPQDAPTKEKATRLDSRDGSVPSSTISFTPRPFPRSRFSCSFARGKAVSSEGFAFAAPTPRTIKTAQCFLFFSCLPPFSLARSLALSFSLSLASFSVSLDERRWFVRSSRQPDDSSRYFALDNATTCTAPKPRYAAPRYDTPPQTHLLFVSLLSFVFGVRLYPVSVSFLYPSLYTPCSVFVSTRSLLSRKHSSTHTTDVETAAARVGTALLGRVAGSVARAARFVRFRPPSTTFGLARFQSLPPTASAATAAATTTTTTTTAMTTTTTTTTTMKTTTTKTTTMTTTTTTTTTKTTKTATTTTLLVPVTVSTAISVPATTDTITTITIVASNVFERTNLPRKDELQRWAGNSVWSMVCAMELGLVSDVSRNNAPFHTVSDERSLVQTNATVSKPSLPLANDCIDAASKTTKSTRLRSSTKRKQKCKFPSRSKSKYSSIGKAVKKSSRKDRGDDSATANHSNTVDKFWRSRKAGLDRSKKRTNQESESSEHFLPDGARKQHYHRESIVDDNDNLANGSNHAANSLDMQIDVPQTRASDQQMSYENDVANFVSRDCNRTEESDLCMITAEILETNELDAFQISAPVFDGQKEQMLVDNDEDVVARRCSKEECNSEGTSSTNNSVEDNASMADRMETEDSSEQPPGSDIALERFDQVESTSFDDTDTLPLAKRISSESRASSEGERNNETTKPVKKAARNNELRNKGSRWGEEYYEVRRVTRGSIKISKDLFVGKLVWGCCSGWWPALIIDADHVGMLSEAGKSWVYWIGEARISLLSEKTQIEPFSYNLKSRLTQNSNEARMRVIDATMQMLRRLLGGTLTKPYFTWIENNLQCAIETLDEIKFYPYPDKIQQRLNRLREKNAKITEKYLLDQKRESQGKRLAEKAKDSLQRGNVDLTHLPLKEQNPGIIAWAKIAGHNWWPAMIIDYRDCCMREPSFGCQWIMWYGDYQLSEVHHQLFMRFDKGMEKMRDYINNTKKHIYLFGVLQASKDYCSRLGFKTENWTVNDALKYFARKEDSKRSCAQRKEDSVKIYDKYSACIAKKLNELKNNANVDDGRTNDIKNSDDLRSAMNGNITFESLCLKCLRVAEGKTEIHPFFEGSLCKSCSDHYKPCMFLFGNDAKCFHCTVCAASGMMIICDKEDCPRVYCTACMKHLLCPTTYEQVLQEDPWECFLCATNNKSRPSFDSIIKPRANWKDKIINMFRTNCKSNPQELVKHNWEKKKIRVLSLFDGLGTGLLVLLKLGLTVDAYYASEIDPDALMVTAAHFGDRIVHLGNVKDITKEKIQEIAPIDLLIGGSPCNDLSLANPTRLGLHDPKGTGILFFEYCRIKNLLKKVNNACHLFWLYENVASMPTEYRLEINRHLGQEPDTIDSADFSPQHRLRLYWHNLPIEIHSLSTQREQDVQDILTPHCQRYSLVKKIRTVTTKVNSLKQGKLALKPILMKDESDSLWITELEEIFGFPRHYTDVKNLSATKRQRLIGKSWSVQTLTAIFRSLCPFFECNTIETN